MFVKRTMTTLLINEGPAFKRSFYKKLLPPFKLTGTEYKWMERSQIGSIEMTAFYFQASAKLER